MTPTTPQMLAPESARPLAWRELDGRVRLFAMLCIVASLALHSVVFTRPHREGDERIYAALVEQLEAGAGYTLQGHPILERSWLSRQQYGEALFHHPPAGPVLFMLAHAAFGTAGFGVVQLSSLALFFAAVVTLTLQLAERRYASTALVILAPLAAFSPLLCHVTTHWWLDGPLLALSTLACALCLRGLHEARLAPWLLGGVFLGLASLVKLTAFLVVPGLLGLVLVCRGASTASLRSVSWASFAMLVVAGMIQLPWEIWQWLAVGSPWPRGAGRPIPALLAANRYVHYVTVVRGTWFYLQFFPQVSFTLVPSLLLLGAQLEHRDLRNKSLVLLGWIVLIVGLHTALGAIGYSKVLRYLVLVTPAVCILFALQAGQAVVTWRQGARRERSVGASVLLVIAALGLALEVAQGVRTTLYDRDLIVPLAYIDETRPAAPPKVKPRS